MFEELSKAPIKEKKYQNRTTSYTGIPEKISFRWQFKGSSQFYRITIILHEEPGKKEELNELVEINISIYVNEASIYLIEKSHVDKLVKILTNFSTRNCGNSYEKNP